MLYLVTMGIGCNADWGLQSDVVSESGLQVLLTPGSILTDWRDHVSAILYMGLPGEQVGHAAGDILFGATIPQAKLPITMPNKENEQGFTVAQYPGIACYDKEIPFPGAGGTGAKSWPNKSEKGSDKGSPNGKCKCTNPACDVEASYTEGQIVGYRWCGNFDIIFGPPFTHSSMRDYAVPTFISCRLVPAIRCCAQIGGFRYDKMNVKPAFGFGHGLTYGGGMTYAGLEISGRTVSFTITGTGCDTPQVYIGYPTAATDPKVPVKVLRHFQKVCMPMTHHMSPNGPTTVSYTLTDRDVSNWSTASKSFTVTAGSYKVYVGSSSQDIRLTGSVAV